MLLKYILRCSSVFYVYIYVHLTAYSLYYEQPIVAFGSVIPTVYAPYFI